MAERNLRRSSIVSYGDPLIFVKRPISATLIIVAVLMIVSSYYRIEKSMEKEVN